MSSGSKKKEPRYTCLNEAKVSHSQRMWTEVSSSAPHLLYSGLSEQSEWLILLPYGCGLYPLLPTVWQMDFHGLHEKLSLTCCTFVSLLCRRHGQPPLEQTLHAGIWYHSLMQHLVGVSYPNLARFHLYTTVTDSTAPLTLFLGERQFKMVHAASICCRSRNASLLWNLKLRRTHHTVFVTTWPSNFLIINTSIQKDLYETAHRTDCCHTYCWRYEHTFNLLAPEFYI